MALKKKLTTEQFEKLNEVLQAEYVKKDDGTYVLEIDGEEDTGALKRAKDRVKEELREAKENLKEAQEKLEEFETTKAKKSGDITALEKSWATKLEDTVARLEAEKTTLEESYVQKFGSVENQLKSTLLSGLAKNLATELSTVPSLMTPVIERRIGVVTTEEGEYRTTILDGDGKPSAMTLDELREEIRTNPEYKSVLIASKASGGAKGDSPNLTTGGGSSGSENVSLSALTDEEKIARITAKIQASKEE